MSNMLAQTTLPTTQVSEASLVATAVILLVVFAGAIVSGAVFFGRRMYRLEPVPAGPANSAVLAGILVAAATMYLAAASNVSVLLGLSSESLKTTEGMRKMLLCQPVIQFFTLGLIVAMLSGVNAIPQELQWRRPDAWFRRAVGAYLLAIPWVLLTAFVIGAIAHHLNLSQDQTQHAIFRTWAAEPAGPTLFKAAAVFSAVIAAPLLEEVFFRGLAQRLAFRLTGRPVLAIVLASLAFTATHSPWPTWPPVFVLSLFLGWLYFRSGSILLPILMHAMFNAVQFALYVSGLAT